MAIAPTATTTVAVAVAVDVAVAVASTNKCLLRSGSHVLRFVFDEP